MLKEVRSCSRPSQRRLGPAFSSPGQAYRSPRWHKPSVSNRQSSAALRVTKPSVRPILGNPSPHSCFLAETSDGARRLRRHHRPRVRLAASMLPEGEHVAIEPYHGSALKLVLRVAKTATAQGTLTRLSGRRSDHDGALLRLSGGQNRKAPKFMKFKLRSNLIQNINNKILINKTKPNSLIRLNPRLALPHVTAFTPLPSADVCLTPL
jgi:hypothetical protein